MCSMSMRATRGITTCTTRSAGRAPTRRPRRRKARRTEMGKNRTLALLAILCILPSARAQQHHAQPPKSVRLYVIDCGTLDIPDTSPYRFKKEELAMAMMSAPCFLVAHPKGTLMWDTGPVPDSNFKPGGGPGTMRYATSTKPLTARLAEV